MRCGSAATIHGRNDKSDENFYEKRRKAHQARSTRSVVVVFFFIHAVVHREFITEGQIVKAEFYIWCKQSEMRRHSSDCQPSFYK